jgi:RNA polymerase sigma-70 factor, ECF subfamily
LQYRATNSDPLVDLVEQAADGHEIAFNELYTATRARVYSQVNRVLQNPALAVEVTQDVFIELWKHSHRYDQAMGSVMAWLLTIARRRAIDRVRHEERRRKQDTRYADDHPTVETDVFDTVDRTIVAERVRQALHSLTDRQRQAVELAYLDGYANLEIAGLLGIPLGTTKTRIRDGLTRLQATLLEQAGLAPAYATTETSIGRRRTQSMR